MYIFLHFIIFDTIKDHFLSLILFLNMYVFSIEYHVSRQLYNEKLPEFSRSGSFCYYFFSLYLMIVTLAVNF